MVGGKEQKRQELMAVCIEVSLSFVGGIQRSSCILSVLW